MTTSLRRREDARAGARVRWRFTDRRDGDLAVGLTEADLAPRRAALAPVPWTWLRQVHRADVVVVSTPGEHAGAEADAAVTTVPGATLAIHTADCAGVLLAGRTADGPVLGAAHAGWRGVREGVLEATVEAMRSFGAAEVSWRMGPCIAPEHYEFSDVELAALEARLGPQVRSTTSSGAPAFDLRAAVRAALGSVGAEPFDERAEDVACTSSERFWSWRTRRDDGRQAALTWIEPP